METKKGKKFRWTMIGICAVCILLGVVLIAWPEQAEVVFSTAVGIALAVVGAVNIVYYFLKQVDLDGMRFELATGAVCTLLGVIFLINRNQAMAWMIMLIGFFLMVGSFILLQIAMNLKRSGGMLSKYMLFSALFVFIVGGLFLFVPFQAGKVLNIFAGIALIVGGLVTAWMVIQMGVQVKKAAQQPNVVFQQPVVQAPVAEASAQTEQTPPVS